MGWGWRRAGPPPHFPAAAAATCRAARCCLPAPPRPGPPPAGQLLQTGRRRLSARVPATPPARRRHAPWGPARGGGTLSGAPSPGWLLEWIPEAGDSEVSLPALLPLGWAALGSRWPQEGGAPLTWEGNDLGRDRSIGERRGTSSISRTPLSSCLFPPASPQKACSHHPRAPAFFCSANLGLLWALLGPGAKEWVSWVGGQLYSERDSAEFESLSPIRPQTPPLPHCFQSKLTNYLQLKRHALCSLPGFNPRPWESSSPWLGLEGGLAIKVEAVNQ